MAREHREDRRERVAVVACGALSTDLASIVERRGWPVDIHPLNPLLHNHPEQIAGEVAQLVDRLSPAYAKVAVGYADCGSYGAVDEVCVTVRFTAARGAAFAHASPTAAG